TRSAIGGRRHGIANSSSQCQHQPRNQCGVRKSWACHPHPRPRHCAEASVAVAARVATIVAATTKIVSIFFIVASLAWQAPNEQNWRYAVGKVIPLFVGIWPAHGIEVPLYYSAGGPIETTCRHRARENEQRGR